MASRIFMCKPGLIVGVCAPLSIIHPDATFRSRVAVSHLRSAHFTLRDIVRDASPGNPASGGHICLYSVSSISSALSHMLEEIRG